MELRKSRSAPLAVPSSNLATISSKLSRRCLDLAIDEPCFLVADLKILSSD
ncbi:hypothetical protein COLO4_37472 [Corchorus olitorius]|uniref:Uncharacterized protein n=1 Tax=Corchorus olitorius TaxID=93759 RepID=A0A1R3G1G6_9ROSI|nr:hypothetical protein COLO4_37472 [Corchorus olitorius]